MEDPDAGNIVVDQKRQRTVEQYRARHISETLGLVCICVCVFVCACTLSHRTK